MPKPKDNDDQVFSSIFKYFLKSPKKRIIHVCLNQIESMSLLCCFQLVFHNFLSQLVCFLGVDIWLKFHTQMLVSIPKFLRTSIVCKRKFNVVYKQNKDDKITNEISHN